MESTKALGFRGVAALDARRVVRADEDDLPATEVLLARGGDARIALDAGGRNRYGCRPTPDPALGGFGSSTASTISAAAFDAAAALRQRIRFAARSEPAAATYARELDRVRREVTVLCGAADLHVDVILAASGTDLHLVAAQLAADTDREPALAITGGTSETGSSVPAALAGRHFSDRSALGAAVIEGTPIADGNPAEVATIALRAFDGAVRSADDVDAEVEALAERAIASGRRVLLFLLDQSKTGLIAPSVACALRLSRRFAGALDVVVDACQLRLAASTVRDYLEQGFAVAVTGSKFATGPAFSGALLLPPRMAARLRAQSIPGALAGYSARADWPDDWAPAESLPVVANWGLLLRWEAALEELRAFRALPEAAVAHFLRSFAAAVGRRLAGDPRIVPLPTRALDRGTLTTARRWDEIPTIFPFVLRHDERRWLTREETAEVHRELARGAARCELGQPVPAGTRDGTAVSALRLCSSARLVVEAVAKGGVGPNAVIGRAIAALDFL